MDAWKQTIELVDLTALSENEQREKLHGITQLVIAASRKYKYPSNWRDYHFSYINKRVVNPLTMMLEYLNQDKIKTSDLVYIVKEYDGIVILASLSHHTITQWEKEMK